MWKLETRASEDTSVVHQRFGFIPASSATLGYHPTRAC